MIDLVNRLKVTSESDLASYEAFYRSANHIFEQDFNGCLKYSTRTGIYYMEAPFDHIYDYAESIEDREKVARVAKMLRSVYGYGGSKAKIKHFNECVAEIKSKLKESTKVDYAKVLDAGFDIYIEAPIEIFDKEFMFILAPKSFVEEK